MENKLIKGISDKNDTEINDLRNEMSKVFLDNKVN